MTTDAAGMAAKRAAQRAAGLCTECDNPRLPEHSVCERHFEMRRKRLEEYNRKRKARKLCFCGAPAKPGRDRCPACLALETKRQVERYTRRREAGLCLICGRRIPRPGKATCKFCAQGQHLSYVRARDRRLRVAAARRRRGQLVGVLGDPLMQVTGV